jgi:repressor LexA
MTALHSTGKPVDFTRSPATGQVTILPRAERAPHWVGRPGGVAMPSVVIATNPLNASVQMLHISPEFQHWASGRPLAVVGEVAAGRYDVTVAYRAGAEAAEVLMLPEDWAHLGYFALRVRGSSMEDAGIEDGDYVLVRPQHIADNGDLVIAGLTDSDDPAGYVTLKQYFCENGGIRLQPANAAMAPIHLYPRGRHDPVGIQGKVVAVVRIEDDGDWN